MDATAPRSKRVLRRTVTISVLTLVASSVAIAQSSYQEAAANTQTEQEIIRTVHDAGQAWARHDLATLEHLLADDYTHTDVVGQFQNRAEWLAYVRSDVIAHQLEFEDVTVRIHGDLAVVTGRNIWRPGTRFLTLPLRFTLVLTKEKGYWQRSVFQAGFEELPRYIFLTFVVAAAVTVFGTWLFVRLRSILLQRWGRARGV
jgi:ketosteroid isomerase-like protein